VIFGILIYRQKFYSAHAARMFFAVSMAVIHGPDCCIYACHLQAPNEELEGCVERKSYSSCLLIVASSYTGYALAADDAAIDHIRTGGEIDLLNSRWASSMSSRSLVVHSPSPSKPKIFQPIRATSGIVEPLGRPRLRSARADLHAGYRECISHLSEKNGGRGTISPTVMYIAVPKGEQPAIAASEGAVRTAPVPGWASIEITCSARYSSKSPWRCAESLARDSPRSRSGSRRLCGRASPRCGLSSAVTRFHIIPAQVADSEGVNDIDLFAGRLGLRKGRAVADTERQALRSVAAPIGRRSRCSSSPMSPPRARLGMGRCSEISADWAAQRSDKALRSLPPSARALFAPKDRK